MGNLIEFRELRRHREAWQVANNAINALKVGSDIAIRYLQTTNESEVTLRNLFPTIEHIHTFNLSSSNAQRELSASHENLAIMAVPHLLALHEDFIISCLWILNKHSLVSNDKAENAKPKKMHATLAGYSSANFSAPVLQEFELLRCIRNSIMHKGGKPNQEYTEAVKATGPEASYRWEEISHRPIADIASTGSIVIRHAEVIVTLAVTKRLWREANVVMAGALTKDQWFEEMLSDLEKEGKFEGNCKQKQRKARGFAREHYSPLAFSNDYIDDRILQLVE